MPFNIPILLTWLRIVMIPLMIAIYYVPDSWMLGVGRDLAAMLVFVVASVTDWLDGYLARRWNETSAFGAFLDPVADKLVVAAALANSAIGYRLQLRSEDGEALRRAA